MNGLGIVTITNEGAMQEEIEIELASRDGENLPDPWQRKKRNMEFSVIALASETLKTLMVWDSH